MDPKYRLQSTDRLLTRLASRPEVADEVSDARVIADRTEVAAKVTERTLTGNDRIQTRTFPYSIYQRRSSEDIAFSERFDSSHRPSLFQQPSVSAITHDLSAKDCESCDGNGWNACNDCDGKSHLPCPDGCGNGRVQCDTCDGETRIECADCGGAGQRCCGACHGDGKNQCNSCYGDGETSCSNCSGLLSGSSGRIPCSRCRGDGKIREFGDEVSRQCPDCRGEGTVQCPECHGTKTLPCTDCGRVGYHPCRKCSQMGTLSCGACDRTGIVTCPNCSDGTQTCPTCDGETTVPCGCGDGRIDCNPCAAEGSVVTAKTAKVIYSRETTNRVESELGITEDRITPSTIENTATDRDINAPDPTAGGQWIERHEIKREEVPVRRVKYSLDGASYEVFDVGGEIHTDSTPASSMLTDAQGAASTQREQLQEEYDARASHLANAIEARRAELIEIWKTRQSRYATAGKARVLIGLLAVAGAFSYITML